MANVDDLMKLNREQLNELAGNNGVDNADDKEAYPNKRDVAEKLAPNLSDEALTSYVEGQKDSANGDEGDTPTAPGVSDPEKDAEDDNPGESNTNPDGTTGQSSSDGPANPVSSKTIVDEDGSKKPELDGVAHPR